MLDNRHLQKLIVNDSPPPLSENFFERMGASIGSDTMVYMGRSLAWRQYFTKPQLWILFALVAMTMIALLNAPVGHSEDDLDRLDALSMSSSLTL